ncbi:MAG: hypothetical protein ACYC2U_02005 [Candidatus Amoebophilus sp.]
MYSLRRLTINNFSIFKIITLLAVCSISSCNGCGNSAKSKKLGRSNKELHTPDTPPIIPAKIDLAFLVLTDEQEFIDKEEIKFKIQNHGDKISTDDIQMELEATEVDMEFNLGKKAGSSIHANLTQILGLSVAKDLVEGEASAEIVLQLKDIKTKAASSTIRLTLTSKEKTIKKTLHWKAGKLEIIELADFSGFNEATFQLKNDTSLALEPKNIVVELTSKVSGLVLEFTDIGKSSSTLGKLLGNNTTIKFREQTGSISFKVKEQPAIETATVTITIKSKIDNTKLAQSTVTWTRKDIELNIHKVDPVELQGSVNTKFVVQIENNGKDKSEASKLQLQLERIQGTNATIDGATVKGEGVFIINLNSLGNIAALSPGYDNPYQIKIIPHADNFAEFEMKLLYDGQFVGDKNTIVWKGKPKVKVTTTEANLKGDNKTTQLTFINESGFDLDMKMLKKVKVQLNSITKDVKIKYYDGDIYGWRSINDEYTTTTLADLVSNSLSTGNSKTVDITINTGKNGKASFELELVGSTSEEKDRKVNVVWNGEPKVEVKVNSGALLENYFDHIELTGHKKQAYLTFIDRAGFELDKDILQSLRIKLNNLTEGAKVLYGTTTIDGASLWDVLGKSLLHYKSQNIILDCGTNKEVSFELELVGSTSEERNRKVKVVWKEGPMVKLESITPNIDGLRGNAAREIKIKVSNEGKFKLEQADLEKVTFNYAKNSSEGKLTKKGSSEDIQSKNLLQLLDKNELTPGSYQELDLTIDNEQAFQVEFTNLKLEGSSVTSKNYRVNWIGEINLALEAVGDLTDLEGDHGKHFEIKVANNSGFALSETSLKGITFTYRGYQGEIIQETPRKQIQGMKLWDVLDNQILQAGESKSIALFIDNNTSNEIIFTDLTLSGGNLLTLSGSVNNVIKSICWRKSLLIAGVWDDKILQLEEGKIKTKLNFWNENKSIATENKLKEIQVKLNNLPADISVFYNKNNTLNQITAATTLWDILGESLASFDSEEGEDGKTIIITIDPGTNTDFQFELELVGSNIEEKLRKAKIHWTAA